MNDNINAIKYQACNVCHALLRNINDNFKSVSFDFLAGGDILLKIILDKITEVESAYIEDIVAELAGMQESDCVLSPQVEIGDEHFPLQYLVYQRAAR